MTIVEAIASGKPVIALRRGGVLEIASDSNPTSGIFFDSPDTVALRQAVEHFEAIESSMDHAALQASVRKFSEAVFLEKMKAVIERFLK